MTVRLILISLFTLSLIVPVHAQEMFKPDDTISFDLSAEDWVTTKTAHVVLDVEAAVSAANAGTIRADMSKAVSDAAKAEWRLTNFSRSQDQTGMERWSMMFDARLPETALNGLADAFKKTSKPGMQIKIDSIDFMPTLDETEAVAAALRTRIYKEAGEQLAALNAAVPGRSYRIAQITFDPQGFVQLAVPQAPLSSRFMHSQMLVASGGAGASPMTAPIQAPNGTDATQDTSQKMVLNAHITFASLPPAPLLSH